MDRNTPDVSGDSEAILSFFGCSKFSVRVYNISDVPTWQNICDQSLENTTIVSVDVILSV